MKKIFILVLLISQTSKLISQNKGEIIIGENHIITSTFLSEDRNIQIYLPDGYEKSSQKYPVMYVLDGQDYFLNPIVYQKTVAFKGKSPDFIVVGITMDRRKRRSLYYQEASKFIDFIKKELISYIDNNYRTLKEKERILFGWEMAGGFMLELFSKYPHIMSAYIMASPLYMTTERINNIRRILSNPFTKEKYLYFTRSPEDAFAEESFTKLNKALTNNSTNLKWNHELLKKEDHYTTPTKTIHNGLNVYFNDYNPIRFHSLKDYEDFGGLEKLKEYYQKRGERYEISTEIQNETKHYLLLQAMKDNNYTLFKYFDSEFTNHLNKNLFNDFWVNRFAGFYVKNNNHQRALEIYKNGLEKFPKSSLISKAIGDIYKVLKNEIKAEEYYQKAIQLDKLNNS